MHRYFSHRAFKTPRWFQFLLACAGWGNHQEPQVEVQVRWLPGWLHPVHVGVEGGHRHAQARQAGLLVGLAQRHRGQVGVAVGVPAGLEPPAELAVQHQQRARPRGVDHQRRAGEVTLGVVPVRRVVVGRHELGDPAPVRAGVGTGLGGGREQVGRDSQVV